MTDDEKNLVNLLGLCSIKHMELPILHTADPPDFVFHIHALQNIVLARDGLRALRNAQSKTDKL